MVPRISLLCLFVGITSTVSAFGGDNPVRNFAPAGLRVMSTKAYDGKADDLLTGGTGTALLADASAVPPIAYADPTKPTAAELRRAALRSAKYNAGDLQGISWGSNIDPATGQVVAGDGKISGNGDPRLPGRRHRQEKHRDGVADPQRRSTSPTPASWSCRSPATPGSIPALRRLGGYAGIALSSRRINWVATASTS